VHNLRCKDYIAAVCDQLTWIVMLNSIVLFGASKAGAVPASLGKVFGNFPREDVIVWGGGPSGFAEGLPDFVDLAGDRLPAHARNIYERALASFPFKDLQGKSRLLPGNRLTVIHQDVLYGKVLQLIV